MCPSKVHKHPDVEFKGKVCSRFSKKIRTKLDSSRLGWQRKCCVVLGEASIYAPLCTVYSVHCTYMTLIRVFYLTNFHFKTIPNKIGHWPILLSSLDESFLHFSFMLFLFKFFSNLRSIHSIVYCIVHTCSLSN